MTARSSGRSAASACVGAHAGDEREPARHPVGVERVAQREHFVRARCRSDLAAERIADAPEELDVRAVELAGAVADPEHVRRAVVPLAREGVGASERLLVPEDQRLVARVEVDLVQLRAAGQIDAAGSHEPQRAFDLRGDRLVALALAAGRHELLVPRGDVRQVGKAALRERTKQVQGRRRLVIRLHEALCVGRAGRLRRNDVVHHVTAKRRQIRIADALDRRGAGLRELPGDAADLHDRHPRRVRQHHGHLEDDPQLLPDARLREKSSNDSAQSPACSRNAFPDATSPSDSVSPRASPANTSGGKPWICLRARSRAPSSGQSGC